MTWMPATDVKTSTEIWINLDKFSTMRRIQGPTDAMSTFLSGPNIAELWVREDIAVLIGRANVAHVQQLNALTELKTAINYLTSATAGP